MRRLTAPWPDAADLAALKAGFLSAADLPGFARERNTVDASDAADEQAFNKCLGIAPTYAARNRGFTYGNGTVDFDSSADVARTLAGAKADMKAFRSAGTPRCVKEVNTKSAGRLGAEIRSMSISKVAGTVANADAAAAYRYTFVIGLGDNRVKVSGYRIAVRVGQTEISLSTSTYNAPAPGIKRSLTLAGKLAKRVRAA